MSGATREPVRPFWSCEVSRTVLAPSKTDSRLGAVGSRSPESMKFACGPGSAAPSYDVDAGLYDAGTSTDIDGGTPSAERRSSPTARSLSRDAVTKPETGQGRGVLLSIIVEGAMFAGTTTRRAATGIHSRSVFLTFVCRSWPKDW